MNEVRHFRYGGLLRQGIILGNAARLPSGTKRRKEAPFAGRTGISDLALELMAYGMGFGGLGTSGPISPGFAPRWTGFRRSNDSSAGSGVPG